MDKILNSSLSVLGILVGLFSYLHSQIGSHSSVEKIYFVSIASLTGFMVITTGVSVFLSALSTINLSEQSTQGKNYYIYLRYLFLLTVALLTIFPLIVWLGFPLVYDMALMFYGG